MKTRTLLFGISLLACGFAWALPTGSAGADDTPSIDPKAKSILEQSTRAYRDLHSLQQETTYTATGTGLGRLLRAKLLVQRPNKLLLELYERDPVKVNGAVH